MIYGGQASDRIGPDESAIPPRGGITLQAAALRVISGGQVPDRIGPDEQFPHAVVLLFKQPLYECGCQASGHIGRVRNSPARCFYSSSYRSTSQVVSINQFAASSYSLHQPVLRVPYM